jgi:hypothetical protein
MKEALASSSLLGDKPRPSPSRSEGRSWRGRRELVAGAGMYGSFFEVEIKTDS